MEKLRRLHVNVSGSCNNCCIFCLDNAEKRRFVSFAEAKDLLARHSFLGQVLFTCGEPTIHPELPIFMEEARREGYEKIALVTNGRRLSYMQYARALVRAGMNETTISIHGHTPRLHDAQTRVKGSFEQTSAGLANLSEIKQSGAPLRIVTSTVVNKKNLPYTGEILSFLRRFPIDTVVLNVVQPVSRALRHFHAVMPEYHEVALVLKDSLSLWQEPPEVRVEGLPFCFMEGFLERAGNREIIYIRQGERNARLPSSRGQKKGPPCASCDLFRECPGVFSGYVKRMGWSGIKPVILPRRLERIRKNNRGSFG